MSIASSCCQTFCFKKLSLGFSSTESWFTARQFLQVIPFRESLSLECSDFPWGESSGFSPGQHLSCILFGFRTTTSDQQRHLRFEQHSRKFVLYGFRLKQKLNWHYRVENPVLSSWNHVFRQHFLKKKILELLHTWTCHISYKQLEHLT